MNFLSRILKIIKKMIIWLMVLMIISSIVYTVVRFGNFSNKAKYSAIIDSDNGNGVDDLFAVVRLLSDPEFEIIGLTSAQYNYFPELNPGSVKISQHRNDTLLYLFGKQNIPNPLGDTVMMDPRTKRSATGSEAAVFIVKKAREASVKKKLNIISMGPLTNIASAIRIDSLIIPKLRIYCLAMNFNVSTKTWNKNEFNTRNDLDALDELLNLNQLEMHIMPLSTAKQLRFGTEEVVKTLSNKGPEWNYLLREWQNELKNKKDSEMPAVALIEAFFDTEFSRKQEMPTPPENLRRRVFVYTDIGNDLMRIDFWKILEKNMNRNK